MSNSEEFKKIFGSTQRIVEQFKPPFDGALAKHNVFLANTIAMAAVERLFEHDQDEARAAAWENFYARLAKRYRAQYQCFDFEVIDYGLFPLAQAWSLIRGPKPKAGALANGNYVTFMGAAQLFGRYQHKAPHVAVGDALATACLNLSSGGAGPETFATPEIIALANAGQAVVLQVLSGRSVGCEEYPGTRMTLRNPTDTTRIDRLKLLAEIWHRSPQECLRLVEKWQQRYVDMMSHLIDQLTVPVVLVWISTRSPEEWSADRLGQEPDFGRFPQLVDRSMLDQISLHCRRVVEVSGDAHLPHGFVSRFTGKRCPVLRGNGNPLWKNDYYPSTEAAANYCARIAGALSDVLGRPARMGKGNRAAVSRKLAVENLRQAGK